MKRVILIAILTIVSITSNAQRYQRIGFVDSQYILKELPSYVQAQNTLNAKVQKWKGEVKKASNSIDEMKKDLANEKAILTKELILERKEEIKTKELELKNLQDSYFGATGQIYTLRQQLVKPIQDYIFNAVRTIAKNKKYDFIFDKSSDLLMLHANKKHDVSKLVIKLIKREQNNNSKSEAIERRKELKKEQQQALKNRKVEELKAKTKKLENKK